MILPFGSGPGFSHSQEVEPGVWFTWAHKADESRYSMSVSDGVERAIVYINETEVMLSPERPSKLIARRLLELSEKWQRCANLLIEGRVRILP